MSDNPLPAAYAKAKAATELFVQRGPWHRIAAYPDSPGDLVARLNFLLSVGVVTGVLVELHSTVLPVVPMLILLIAAGVMGIIACQGDGYKLLYLSLSLAIFAVGFGGGLW